MDNEDKKEILRMLHNRITETNYGIQTCSGRAQEAARKDKSNLEDMCARIERERVGEQKDDENYVNFAIPAECMPVLQSTVNQAMMDLAKENSLGAKRTMLGMLKLQIVLMGGK